eukprot:753692-Hanusia_phi.AAC.2
MGVSAILPRRQPPRKASIEPLQPRNPRVMLDTTKKMISIYPVSQFCIQLLFDLGGSPCIVNALFLSSFLSLLAVFVQQVLHLNGLPCKKGQTSPFLPTYPTPILTMTLLPVCRRTKIMHYSEQWAACLLWEESSGLGCWGTEGAPCACQCGRREERPGSLPRSTYE